MYHGDTEGIEFHREKGKVSRKVAKKRKALNRKDRNRDAKAQRAQRAQRDTRSPCGLCVFLAPFAVQFLLLSVKLRALRVSVVIDG
jgi:hypothetical protein